MAAKRATTLLTIIMALILSSALAWGAAEEPPTLTAQVVHSHSAYAQGGTYPLIISLTVRPGYHINAQRPAEPDLYPTSLMWPQAADLSFTPAVFPAPHPFKPSFSDKPFDVLDGTVMVRGTFKVAATAAPGPHQLKAQVKFQACDDQSCLMPETLEVPLAITVSPAGKPGQPLNAQLFK